ncbi:YdbC family protein [Metabacillus schmidteae]|uniref:YdbC family protein n=1 Tax=Metabacillus schmidteae TaxID=2730405 RepID=UPI0038B2E212
MFVLANIKYEIQENVGTISEGAKGWKRELNLISWNNRDPKYDLRDWDEQHEKMGKGLTLSKEELIKLRDLLNGLDL